MQHTPGCENYKGFRVVMLGVRTVVGKHECAGFDAEFTRFAVSDDTGRGCQEEEEEEEEKEGNAKHGMRHTSHVTR